MFTYLLIVFKGTPIKDVTITNDHPSQLLLEKHISYIHQFDKQRQDYVRIFCFKAYRNYAAHTQARTQTFGEGGGCIILKN